MEHRFGRFNADGAEFTVTDPATPRPFDNLLWNDSAFSIVQQTGVGCFDYQFGNTEGIQLLTGTGRICDFDMFGRDHLMSRLIYIRDNANGEFWNVNWEPVRKPFDHYECVHGLGYTMIRSTTCGIAAEFRLLVPPGSDAVELGTLRLTNNTARERSLSVFVYNQVQFKFKWGFDSYGDMVYRNALFDRSRNAVIASKHPFRRPHEHLTGFLTADRTIDGWDGSRDAFVGLYQTLASPEAVIRGRCTGTPGSGDATLLAAQFNLTLPGHGAESIALILGAGDGPEDVDALRERHLGRFDQHLEAIRNNNTALMSRNVLRTPDAQLNRLANSWIKQETLYGAAWCRWGYMGYRDIVQHGLGVCTLKPERTREILLEALQRQFASGLALRGWNPVDEKPYSDSALWIVFTAIAHLKETGDLALLDETAPFYDGGEATVREHMDRALDFLESNKGAHGLLLIKFGDWNDSLTGTGKEGRGESIWLSEAYAEAMAQMAGLAAYRGETQQEAGYRRRREAILDALEREAWNGQWYTRCFDDHGRPVGSPENEQGQIFFEAQAWALIAGLARDDRGDRRETLLRSCDERLLTKAGYRLLAPSFTRLDDNIGRISSMEPGVAENGTIYSHLNIWMILGLLRCGLADRAYDVFRRVAPGYVEGEGGFKQNCPPYVIANCYFGPEHRNSAFQMEFTWITGSVAWFNHVLLNDFLGARAEYDALVIDPCLPSAWTECAVTRTFRGAVYHIEIRNPEGLERGIVEVRVDGEPIKGNRIPIYPAGGVHQVEATLRVKPAEHIT